VHTRLIMYKRISSSLDEDELQDLQVEMIDRFGLLPETLKLLFRLTRLKLKAEFLGIRKIDGNVSGGRIEFISQTQVDPMSLVQLVQDEPLHYKLSGANQLQFKHSSEDASDKLDFIAELLDKFKLLDQQAA